MMGCPIIGSRKLCFSSTCSIVHDQRAGERARTLRACAGSLARTEKPAGKAGRQIEETEASGGNGSSSVAGEDSFSVERIVSGLHHRPQIQYLLAEASHLFLFLDLPEIACIGPRQPTEEKKPFIGLRGFQGSKWL